MNSAYVSRHDLARMLEAAGWPPVPVYGRITAGPEWNEVLTRCPPVHPPERANIARVLGQWPLLDITEPGRTKHLEWAENPTDPGDLAERVKFYGDEAVFPAILYALRLVPPPVRAYAVAHAAFLAVGRSLTGWIMPALPPGRSTIAISGAPADDAVVRTVLHELGHLWACPAPSAPALTELETQHFLTSMIDPTKAAASLAKDETIANMLALSWSCAGATPHALDGPRIDG